MSHPVARLNVAGLDSWGVVGVTLLVSLSILGCGSESPASPAGGDAPTPVATTLTLSASVLSFSSLGATEQLTPTVLDQNGATMSGASVAWASSREGLNNPHLGRNAIGCGSKIRFEDLSER